jgi:hypothetical protein
MIPEALDIVNATDVTMGPQGTITGITWAPGHKLRAFDLAKEHRHYKPSSRGCLACNIKALNIVRELADLPPIGGEASESLRTRRLNVCRGSEGDGTDACEHLAWPGLNCGLCGCFVDVKAAFKRLPCPANKWPMR